MKTILLVLMTILCAITARSQGFMGLTRDTFITRHDVFLDEYRILNFINDDGDSVTVLDGGYYVVIAHFPWKTHICDNYNMILDNNDLQEAFMELMLKLPMKEKGVWETDNGILISFFGWGDYSIKEYTWSGYTYNFRPSINYYLKDIRPK